VIDIFLSHFDIIFIQNNKILNKNISDEEYYFLLAINNLCN